MTSDDISAIETALHLRLPARFRQFMHEHAADLKQARSALVGEDVLEVNPTAIVKLNAELRRHGIDTGDHSAQAPWPTEYLALSDNGAGDHLCIKATEDSTALYEFNGEEGRFARAFKSLDAYLADLNKRVAKFAKSAKGKSDKALLKRAPGLHADAGGLNLPLLDIEPPATVEKAVAFGIDVERLRTDYAALLEAVTRIARQEWSIVVGPGKYPVQLRLDSSTRMKPRLPFKFSGFQTDFGHMRLSLQLDDPKSALDASAIDWDTLHHAMASLFSNVLRTPVRMAPGKIKAGKPTVYGYVGIEWTYAMIRA